MIGEVTQLYPGLHPDLHRRIVADRAWHYLAPAGARSTASRLRPVPLLHRRELLQAALLVSMFLAAQIAVAGPRVLYNRTCWMDEYITQLLVSDPSVGHSVEAVRHGVDGGPPVYQLLGRVLVRSTQALCETSVRTTLRLFSTCCVIGAVLSAYVILRQAFAPGASIIALLAVLPHPQLVEQMFEARSSAPVLGASLALALSFQLRATDRASSVLRAIAIGLSAAMLCTLHASGTLIFGILTAAALFYETGSLTRRLWRVAPAAAGVIALLAFATFTPSQGGTEARNAVHVTFSFRGAREFLTEIFYPLPLLVVLAGWCVGNLFRQNELTTWQSQAAKLRATVPLLSLAVVPVGILLFSLLGNATPNASYALVATFAIGPVSAMLASTLRPRVQLGIAVPLAIMGFMQIFGTARMHREVQRINSTEASLARNDATGVPIVFADRSDATELADLAPDLVPRIYLMDERQTPFAQLSNRRRSDLEMMRKASAFYATPPLVTPIELAKFDRVRIVAASDDLSRLLQEVPMRRIGEHLFQPTSD